MARNEQLDDRISGILADWGTTRKKMFGGVGYMLGGNMLAGVHKDNLVLRLGPEVGDQAPSEPHVRAFDSTSGTESAFDGRRQGLRTSR